MTDVVGNEPIDEFHVHEAMDRCWVLAENIGLHLLDHPFFADPENRELSDRVQAALTSLMGVYQTIGARIAQTRRDE